MLRPIFRPLVDVFAEVLIQPGFALPAEEEPLPDLVEVAVSVDALSTLVAAVTLADLVGVLQSPGPFTVFAPTNDAFAALGEEALGFLTSEDGIPLLTDVLLYHVVVGAAVFAADISDKQKVETALGETVKFRVLDKGLFIKDSTKDLAKVIIPDVEASNGVAHVIDSKFFGPQIAPDIEAKLEWNSQLKIVTPYLPPSC